MGVSRSAYYDAPVPAPDDTAIVEEVSRLVRDVKIGWDGIVTDAT